MDKSYNTGKYDNGGIFKEGDKYEDVASHWHSANGMAVWMADSEPEMIIQWDENYNFFVDRTTMGGWEDIAPVYMNNNMISIENGGHVASFHYNGNSWITSERQPLKYTGSSFGQDFMVINHRDNRNQGQIYYLDHNTFSWKVQEVSNTNNAVDSKTSAGPRYATFGNQYYHQAPNGTWNQKYIIPDYNGWNQAYAFSGGYHLFTVNDKPYTYVHSFRSGQTEVYPLYNQSLYTGFNTVVNVNGSLINSNIVVTFPNTVDRMEDAYEIILHKLIDGGLTGRQTSYPVTRVTVHNGYQELPTTYAYTASSATMSAGGYTAQFNKVTVIPGSSDAEIIPYGYTELCFFNGLPPELIEPIPAAVYLTGHTKDYYSKLTGVQYVSYSYNSQKELVAQHQNDWTVAYKEIKTEDGNTVLDRSYLVQSLGSKQIQDGFTQLMTYFYNDSGQRTSTTVTNSQGIKRSVTVRYPFYFEDDYLGSDLLRERHMVGQAVLSTTTEYKLGLETLQKSETHYALQDATQTNSAPVPVKTVVYPNGEDESYSITSTYQYDQYGNLLQSQTEGGLISSYGYDYIRPVAEAIEATYAELKAELDPATIQDKDGNALRQALDGLRTGLPKAHIATTTYDPFYGNVLSVTDPRGRTSTSSYDQLGRLRVVKDHDGYVRQKVEYSLQK